MYEQEMKISQSHAVSDTREKEQQFYVLIEGIYLSSWRILYIFTIK